MVALNQMPISFCSSLGFKQFMNVVEPNYKPCSAGTLSKRLDLFFKEIKGKVKCNLEEAMSVSCTTDCWTSRSLESYITITAHIIDTQWKLKTFTLTTHEFEERHTAGNIAEHLGNSFVYWGIENKINAVVTDNALNIVNAVSHLNVMEKCGLTCSAHTLQLAVNIALNSEDIKSITGKASKIVGHFKHSVIAMKSLEKTQEQLGKPNLTLLQSCKTRWNSCFFMLERLLVNRISLTNVLADRSVTTARIAQNIELSGSQWICIETLVQLLKPLQALTTIFCSESDSPVSMVRPLVNKILSCYYQAHVDDDDIATQFKATITYELTTRFHLSWNDNVLARQIASFLDPRYKDLEYEALECRETIRSKVKELVEAEIVSTKDNAEQEKENVQKTNALAFIYQEGNRSIKDAPTQFAGYLSEPQLRFDLNPFEWWKAREEKYPVVAAIAKKYLSIPATSASSERCFSTAGNIVTSKRNCLNPENVNMLAFLYQNKGLYI